MKVRKIQIKIFQDEKFIEILSMGRANDLNVAFSLVRTIDSTLNQCDIMISNLNYDTESKINSPNSKIVLYAGWIDDDVEDVKIIHQGDIKVVDTASFVTKVTSVDSAKNAGEAITNKNFSGELSLQQVVLELIKDFQDVSAGKVELSGKLNAKGRVFAGKTLDCLDQLAHQFGFTYSIQNNVFQAFMDDKDTEKVFFYTDQQIENLKKITSSNNNSQVFSLTSFLDTRINVGDIININSLIKNEQNGNYVVLKHAMQGASHENTWLSKFELEKK